MMDRDTEFDPDEFLRDRGIKPKPPKHERQHGPDPEPEPDDDDDEPKRRGSQPRRKKK